jgi:Putative transposase, YhgA-like
MSRQTHDTAYRDLFTHPRLIRDLVEGYGAASMPAFDYSTLRRVNASFVTPAARSLHADMVWQIKAVDGQMHYVYLLIELQSSVDATMPIRMVSYVTALHLQLIKQKVAKAAFGGVPRVLPFVVYTGEGSWTAPRRYADLMVEPESPAAVWDIGYNLVIVERSSPSHATIFERRNLLAAICRLEGHADADVVIEVIGALHEWLREEPEFKSSVLSWISRRVNSNIG